MLASSPSFWEGRREPAFFSLLTKEHQTRTVITMFFTGKRKVIIYILIASLALSAILLSLGTGLAVANTINLKNNEEFGEEVT
ncbi:MAG: hypothetical protein PQJ60_12565, partial [Spirochaetales bacterium]|nr:hypothetical protein [Spirochaetales bacterium]